MSHKASILTIGTELITGQITNSHSAWISERLVARGIEVVLHETVADDRTMILKSLERCANHSQLIFVCGGLGPTTDDFTRNVVTSWAGASLEFDEPAMQYIIDRLTRVGVPVVASQRQQCFFPKGSKILFNSQGTAHGFALRKGTKAVWVFPGPPKELHAIWDDHMNEELAPYTPSQAPTDLFTWKCAGKSEAEIGELTEAAIKGSHYATGYRASFPYVEVKVWCPSTVAPSERQKWLDKIELSLEPWIISRQGQDIGSQFLTSILQYSLQGQEAATEKSFRPIQIIDVATHGALGDRLGVLIKKIPEGTALPAFEVSTRYEVAKDPEGEAIQWLENANPEVITLVVTGFDNENHWTIGLKKQKESQLIKTLTLPYKGAVTETVQERRSRLVVELALKQWREWL